MKNHNILGINLIKKIFRMLKLTLPNNLEVCLIFFPNSFIRLITDIINIAQSNAIHSQFCTSTKLEF